MSSAHIKVPDIVPMVRYSADGTTSVFPYPFPVFASEDLCVYFDGAQQFSGFTVSGAGDTSGGTVTFENAPINGTVILLERRMKLERLTDFLEGGDFSAQALNNELDFLVAAIQQVDRDQISALKYAEDEAAAAAALPPKMLRANKVLGFDGNGDPIAVTTEGTMAQPNFTATGTGAIIRTTNDKMSDVVSVKDFGAVGDGIADDTLAIQQALTARQHIFLPEGTYKVTSTLTVGTSQSLYGCGHSAVIAASSDDFNVIEIPAGYASLSGFKITGGHVAVKLYGRDAACVQNLVSDLHIVTPVSGIVLDGYDDTNYPCYWNNIVRVLIEGPSQHGVYMLKSGAGDTPNANRFYAVRVFSKGASTNGSGFYIEDGKLNNSFMDCEANVAATADSCFRIGGNSDKTLLVNLYTEAPAGSLVPNVLLDSGSVETSIFNLTSMSDGAAILDQSGGNYDAYNAGSPDKNTLRKTTITDLKATLNRYDTEYIDTAGTTSLDLSHSVHIVDATNGSITIELPLASAAAGVEMLVKRKDSTDHLVTIDEAGGGDGPDGAPFQLGGEGDYATMLSNGAAWFVTSSNRIKSNTKYIDGTGIIDIDMSVNTYILSSFNGAMTARLPPADADEAVGRTVTLKKTDVSANAVTVTEQGGNGSDQSSQTLSSQYDAITVVSDGGQWYIVSKY